MTNQRFQYYSAWLFTDGTVIASGLGYNGKDPKTGSHRFDRIISINVLALEFASSPNIMITHWNHMIHIWLKHYIYLRTLKVGQKPGVLNNMATFLVSAFWHGFYPFYYIMFFFAGLLGEVAKDFYRSRILFSFIPSPLGLIIGK
jgi:lysophospholipid acyltransferase